VPRRPPATLADYVLVGINPALIMFLIGSLVCYLLCIFYGGGYDARVMFIFANFIMGAVAVCRISMEEGTGYAASFGFPLGLLTLFALTRFGEFGGFLASFSLLINAGIIGLIWWLAYQLTWDCTVMDERADTSDQGLLQAAGLEGQAPTTSDNAAEDPLDPQLAQRDAKPEDEPSPWMKWLERSKQPHAHGVWVIYFSLLALPAFGLGQWFLPTESRTFAFGMLVIYVATALALLLSTSFLGLRRYLRQRRLEMPVEMTANWLIIGGMMIVATLAICLLIPRPGAELAVSQLPFPKMGTQNLSPSRWSMGNDGQKKDPNARAGGTNQEKTSGGQTGQTSGSGNQQGNSGQNSNQQSQGQQPSSSGSQNNAQSPMGQQSNNSSQSGNQAGQKSNDPMKSAVGQQSQANQQPNNTTSSSSNPPNQAGNQSTTTQSQQSQPSQQSSQPQQQSSPSRFSPSQFIPSFGNLFKLLMYAAIAAVLGFLAWRYRRELAAAWQQLLKELRELWERLFGRGESTTASGDGGGETPPLPRPFSAYVDPFLTGRASQFSRIELLRYTFEALQAWGREHGCPREASETPHEYAQRLATKAPHVGREAAALSDYYGQAAYAGAQLPASIADPLRSLWHKLGASAAVA
jgi:hypothetical protein